MSIVPSASSGEQPDTFDTLTAGLSSATPLSVMFDEVEEHLAAAHPEGYTVKDAGRLVMQSLPEADRGPALDELLYVYWSARENDREELARYGREKDARAELGGHLALYRYALDNGMPPSYELLADIARLANQLMGGGR